MAKKRLQKVLSLLLAASMTASLLNITATASVPAAQEVPETHTVTCTACEGSGQVDCTACEGTGKVDVMDETTGESTGEQADCTACEGTGKVNCSACGGTGKVTCSGHYEIDMSQTIATCARSGKAVYVCPVCGAEFVQDDVILNHEPTTVTVTTPATCTEKGEEECYCEICDASYTRSIPALGHAYDASGICTQCGKSAGEPGNYFKVDDCWEQYNGKDSFDTFSLTCEILTAAENGENGTAAVVGWAGAEGNTSATKVYILIPPTVTDDYGNTYDVTQVTANFQMNQTNQSKGKLLGFYLKAPEVKELTVNSMFADQTNLQVLDLGSSLEVIGVGCFSGCKKLGYSSSYPVVLPESLKEIGIAAFKSVPMVKQETLDIPSSVTYIGTGAFENTNLKSITGGEGVTSLSGTVFQYSSTLKSVDFPNLTQVDSAAFFGSGITQVGWDWSEMTSIGESAFNGCYGLSGDLVLSGDCQLGKTAFVNTGFSSVTIGEGMTEIPDSAFSNCGGLTEINLPNSLTTIGSSAFSNAGSDSGDSVQVTIGSDDGSRLSEVKSGAFADGSFNITVNTSEDNIANTASLGDNVTYTVASIETTKSASDLQTLINEAESGATIDLTESYDINAQVTIPEGKDITLTSSNGSVIKGTVSGYMFSVPANASLTLGEGLTAMVRSARLVESAGTFTLDGAEVTGGSAGMNQGVIHITDGGIFNLESGTISGAVVTNQYAGTVLLSESAEMTMTGGTISKNNAEGQLNSGAGVTVCQGAAFTMEDGTISENTAFRGAGVLVFGGTNAANPAYDEDTAATFIMNGGTISGNTVSGWLNNLRAAGGGVYVQENARFIMNAGTISGNTSDHQGGGVATQDEDGNGGVFTMNGGVISGNKAVNGGGVYSYSKAVKLLAGRIENNEASGLGGGMYVSTHPYSIQLGEALITGNSATVMGGGIWSCPTGTIDFADGHFAIYENTAGKAGDDVAALNKDIETITTLGGNMLGGGVMAWYEDAKISAIQLNGEELGAIAEGSLRYADGTARINAPVGSRNSFSAKAIVTDDAKALVTAALIITGNRASQGGGIGSNGIVTLPGDPVTTDSLTVNKVWVGSGSHPDSVTAELVATTGETVRVLDRAELSQANQWSYTFHYVPLQDTVYSVEEIVPSGYSSAVTVDETTGIYTITNTKQSSGGSYDYYKVTINYYDQDGNVIYSQYVSPDIREGRSWDYSDRQLETITVGDVTYTFDRAEGDPISGTNIRRDQVVDLYYAAEEELPEEDVPQGEQPEDPTDIPEEDVPQGEQPSELPEEDVPLADVPETGDLLGLWLALAGLSGSGLAAVGFTGRKKRDEEQ